MMSALCPCGLVVLWSCGPVVLWASGSSVLRSCGLRSQVHSMRPLILCGGEMLWIFCGLSGEAVVMAMFPGSRMHDLWAGGLNLG